MSEINNIDIRINGPNIIPTIERPITYYTQTPIVRSLEVPIIDITRPIINYPIIDVPNQEQFNTAVKSEQKRPEEVSPKDRKLHDTNTSANTPSVSIPQITPPQSSKIETTEITQNKPQPTFTVFGTDINIPDPSLVATAGSVAIITTATTMVATTLFNSLKNVLEPVIKQVSKTRLNVKIRRIRPVLHYVLAEEGHIDIFEYSSRGTRLVEQVDKIEQYIRDQIDMNSLYEIDNKIIIDDVIKSKFTKEGQKRFKSLFVPPQKIAKKLSARVFF